MNRFQKLKIDISLELDRLCEPHEVLDYSIDRHRHIVYAAVRHPKGHIYAAAGHYYFDKAGDACLDGDEFDDETTGFYSDMVTCPKRILKKLSPTTREFALNWRAACLNKSR